MLKVIADLEECLFFLGKEANCSKQQSHICEQSWHQRNTPLGF